MWGEIIQELYGSNSKYFIVMDVLHNPRIAGDILDKAETEFFECFKCDPVSTAQLSGPRLHVSDKSCVEQDPKEPNDLKTQMTRKPKGPK